MLVFDSSIGKKKPESIVNKNTTCPFCDVKSLETIIDREDSIILVENKFPTLRDTYQTVLIETDQCDLELSDYPKEHLHKVFRFGIKHWQKMSRSGDYKSVLFYKNHGPLSGGTIHHPHMQIVGLKNVDYRQTIGPDMLKGLPIHEMNGVRFFLSTHPKMGFTEFAVSLSDPSNVDDFADYVQTCVHYLLNSFVHQCKSYNLFFYELDGTIVAKIIPRFVASPLYVGFGIPQVSSNLEQIVADIQHKYFL